MKRLYAAIVLALLFFAFPFSASTGRASEGQRVIGYRVDLSRPETGLVTVSMEVEAFSQPLDLEIQDSYGDGLAVDLASHIINETAADASGKNLPMRREGDAWKIDATGIITITYNVNMSGYEAGTEYLNSLAGSGNPWPYFPLLEPDLAYLPGYAIFIYPSQTGDYQPRLELVIPPEWQQALPWADQPERLEELLSNPLLAGELAIEEEGSLTIALPSASAAASGAGLEEYGEKALTLLQETENLFGGMELADGQRLLMALLFRGEGDRIIDTYLTPKPFSRCVVLSGPSRNDILSDSSIEATARGLVYLSANTAIAFEPEALWLREGTAWYYQDLLPYSAGIWGAQTFWNNFNRHYDVYRDARERLTVSLAESGSLAADSADAAAILNCGGASACAALDSELKAQQPPSSDLASGLRNLEETARGETPIVNDTILSMLESMTARNWTVFFSDYISGNLEIPPSSFSSLNVAPPEEVTPSVEGPETSTSTAGWVTLVVAVIIVFVIPFILEPYTMRPRKPGFLEKKLDED